jgi:hypothetical protein
MCVDWMTWKSYVLASGGLLATYVASGPVRPAQDVAAPRRVAAARANAATDIQEQAMRLQARERQRGTGAFRPPSRNPFRFSMRPAPARVVVESSAPPVALTAPVRVPPAITPPVITPVITLSGVATDDVGGTLQRTAILSTGGGVLLVREGDAVGADYKVAKIDEAWVDLVATDGSVRRVSFKP